MHDNPDELVLKTSRQEHAHATLSTSTSWQPPCLHEGNQAAMPTSKLLTQNIIESSPTTSPVNGWNIFGFVLSEGGIHAEVSK